MTGKLLTNMGLIKWWVPVLAANSRQVLRLSYQNWIVPVSIMAVLFHKGELKIPVSTTVIVTVTVTVTVIVMR